LRTNSKTNERKKENMGLEKDRKLRRRQRRRKKLRKLKAKLVQTKDLKKRQEIIAKITKISVYLPNDLPQQS
jgi:hypothetical protein